MKALRIAAVALASLMALVTVASWFAAIWIADDHLADQVFATGFLSMMVGVLVAAAASFD